MAAAGAEPPRLCWGALGRPVWESRCGERGGMASWAHAGAPGLEDGLYEIAFQFRLRLSSSSRSVGQFGDSLELTQKGEENSNLAWFEAQSRPSAPASFIFAPSCLTFIHFLLNLKSNCQCGRESQSKIHHLSLKTASRRT